MRKFLFAHVKINKAVSISPVGAPLIVRHFREVYSDFDGSKPGKISVIKV